MAGGSGLRLWPLSRRERPKPFMRRPGARLSLLAETAARLGPHPLDRTFVSVARGAEHLVEEHLPGLPAANVIVEPEARDTLPSMLLATAHVARRFPSATMLTLASDHAIGDVALFHDAVERALRAARAGPYLVSIGIRPSGPSTRFGYMALGEPYPGLPEAWFGSGYVEKPDLALARRLFRGGHDWNAGMFAWTIPTFLSAVSAYAPGEKDALDALCAAEDAPAREALYGRLRRIDLDRGLLEHVPAAGGAVRHVFVRGHFEWDDLGTFPSLTEELARDDRGNAALRDVELSETSHTTIINESAKTVVGEGLHEAVIVVADEGDVLIAAKHGLDDLRALLSEQAVPASGALVRSLEAPGHAVHGGDGEVVGLLHVRNVSVTIEADRITVRQAPRTFVATDEPEFASLGAELVVEALAPALARTPDEVLVTMSVGSTPVGIYETLRSDHRSSVDWSRVRFVQMDEWAGIGPDDPRSFASELTQRLVEPLGASATLLDGRMAEQGLLAIEDDVLARGGFALALHGIGTNGHIGFNEPPLPGDARRGRAHVADLSAATRRAAHARFGQAVPSRGLTLGMASLARAAKTILVARGRHKAMAVANALGEPSQGCPASWLPRTGALDILVDRDAVG